MKKKDGNQKQEENALVLCRKIKEDVEREINVIILDAQKEAAAIMRLAQEEAANKKDEILKKFNKESQQLKEKIFSTINIEKKRIVLDEKNRLIEEVFEQLKTYAQEFRNKPEYINFLNQAALGGIGTIDADDIDIFYSFLDEKIITADFKKNIENQCRESLKKSVSIKWQKKDFNDIGVIVQSSDGHLVCDNCFLSRFKLKREEFYMSLLREVF
ncbi:MAG: V-type ATP synthase subunit E [Candidatus Omnitrophica bacterium]|nr:V-type ATP synthase subunit E [Candidatus Omnitrophota bacterium]